MKIVDKVISNTELKEMSKKMFDGLVNAVVDIEKEIMAVDAEMHADEECILLEHDSKQENLWGINIYPDEFEKDTWIEFDSMINMRPWQNNRSRGVDDQKIQERIKSIVKRLVTK
jgi:hypothetical protein